MNGSKLQTLLRQAGRAERRSTLIASVAFAGAACLVTLLVVIAIDAVLGVPGWMLRTLDGALIAAAVIALIYVLRQLYTRRYDAHRIARRLEQCGDVTDSSLLNALDLSQQTDAAVSKTLRQSAVERGEQAAGHLQPTCIVDRRRVRRALWRIGAAAVVMLAIYLILPGVFHAVLPRLLEPGADHPPFTLMRFEVAIQPDRVMFGKPAAITAAIRGPRMPGQASVVFVEDDGSRRPLPMMRLAGALMPASTGRGESTPTPSPDGSQFVLHIERAERDRRFYIQTPYGRSDIFILTVQPVPLFEDVMLTYDYPAYTGWAAAHEPLGTPGIRALVGTQVTVAVKSNVPLGEGKLTLTGDEKDSAAPITVPLKPTADDPRQATAAFPLQRTGRFGLALVGIDGTPGDQPLSGQIHAIEDGKPQVHIVEPDARIVVPEGWKVPVKLEITDDIGVAKLVLHRGVNGWGPSPADLTIHKTDTNHGTGEATFDLFPLGAVAGDVIVYHAVGYDTHPPLANTAESDVHIIEVVSWDDYVTLVRTRYGLDQVQAELSEFHERLEDLRTARESLLKASADLQKQMESGQPLTTEQQKQLDDLQQQMRDYQKQAAELAKQMQAYAAQPQVYDFQAPLQQMMRELAAKVQGQSSSAAGVADAIQQSGPSHATLQALQAFAQNNEPFTQQTDAQRQRTAADMQKLELAQKITEQAARIRQVALQQQELTRRMAEFRHIENLSATQQLRAAKMAEEQAALQSELADAVEKLRGLCQVDDKLLPKMQGQGVALADKIDNLKIADDQQDAAHLAAAGEGRYAHQAADSAARKLDSLLSDCEGAGQQAADSLDGCLKLPRQSWANAMKQLGAGQIPGMGQSGNSGGGYAGSSAQFAIVGPMHLGRGDSMLRQGSRGSGESRGNTSNTELEQLNPSESLSATTVTEQAGNAAPMPGVPLRYRAMVEAYFRRLADDSR